MATFRKRGESWIAEICVKGKRKSKTFSTKARAKVWAAEAESEFNTMAEGASPVHTLNDVFERYADEVSEKKKGARWEIIRLKKFGEYALAKRKLIDLRREHIESWIDERLQSVKPSSVNRELNLLSHCLTQARRWRLMNHNPMDDLKRPKNPANRERRISDDEIEIVLVALSYDEFGPVLIDRQVVAVVFLFAIETAMRAGEIAALTKVDIDRDNRTAHLRDTKNGLPRNVPLSERALELIDKISSDDETVFGITSRRVSDLFAQAVRKTNIDDLTFHDSRHEATTRLAQKLQVLDLARVTGHRDIKQLMTYYNKSAADLAKLL